MPLDAQNRDKLQNLGKVGFVKKKKKNGKLKEWGDGKANGGDGQWRGGAVVVMWRCLGGGVVIRSDGWWCVMRGNEEPAVRRRGEMKERRKKVT